MTNLRFGNNTLSGTIPPEIGQITALQDLRIWRNNFNGTVPSQIGSLANLIWLFLEENQFSGQLPTSIATMPALRYLWTFTNPGLRGCMPYAMNQSCQSVGTSMCMCPEFPNNCTGLPLCNAPSAAEQTALRELARAIPGLQNLPSPWSAANAAGACFNNWTGVNCNNSAIYEIEVESFGLTGTIPPEIGLLTKTVGFTLSNNSLTGGIPPEVGTMSKLVDFRVWDNKMNGTVPSSLGNVSTLENLFLEGNQFSGTFPASVLDLPKLTYLWLFVNRFEGCLKASRTVFSCELAGNAELCACNAAGATCNGISSCPVPSAAEQAGLVALYNAMPGLASAAKPWNPALVNTSCYEKWTGVNCSFSSGNVVGIELAGLNLAGSVPDGIRQLKNLDHVFLSQNRLDGTLPSGLNELASLRDLRLDGNNITGSVPSLSNLTSLRQLWLQSNILNGSLPASFGSSPFVSLRLNGNQFSGAVPSLSSAVSLQSLHLEDNAGLTGCLTLTSAPTDCGTENTGLCSCSPPQTAYCSISVCRTCITFSLTEPRLTSILLSAAPLAPPVQPPPAAAPTLAPQAPPVAPPLLAPLAPPTAVPLQAPAEPPQSTPVSVPQTVPIAPGVPTSAQVAPQSAPQSAPQAAPAPQPSATPAGASAPAQQAYPAGAEPASRTPTGPLSPQELSGIGNTDNTGAIAGGVVAAVVVIAAIIAALVALRIRRARRDRYESAEKHIAGVQPRRDYDDMGGGSGSGAAGPNIVIDFKPEWMIDFQTLSFGKKIGSGAYGQVFKGKWHQTVVAIKQSNITAIDKEALDALKSEAALMLNLRAHPNIVQVLGICVHDANVFVVLKFCSEGSLDGMFGKGTLTLQRKLEILAGIASGVHHLHEHNIVHRDLAARNVLMDAQTPLISDFGMARLVDNFEPAGQTRSTVGPLRWMAPESLDSQKRLYSPATDVWTFGVVCVEILSEAEPYPGMEILDVAMKVLHEGLTPSLPMDCPAWLADLCHRCWDRNPANRPSMEEITQIFAAHLDNDEE